MSLAQFLSILRARWASALAVFVLVVSGAVGASLLLPKGYYASASVVIDIKPDPISALGVGSGALPAVMATQVDILTSERVAERVIKDLGLDKDADYRASWEADAGGRGSYEQWLSDILLRPLDVRPSRESNVISVGYQSRDPEHAAAMANAFAKAYIATTLELRVDPARQFNTFFSTQTKEARENLERAQAKLSSYQREKGLTATDERFDVENTRLNELSSQLTQVQALSAESRSRNVQARAQADKLQEVLNNPVISGLKSDLSRQEARLGEMLQRLGDAHPQVVEARANIAELRSRLEAETQRVGSGVGVAASINQGREAQLRASLAQQRARVLELKAVRDEGQVLQREVENAQRVYDGLIARTNQTSLEAQATQSFVHLLSVARPPLLPSSPKVLRNAALGVFLGLMLALGTALLLELMDRRIRSTADAVATLGLPVLGVLPTPKAKRFIPAYRPTQPAAADSLISRVPEAG